MFFEENGELGIVCLKRTGEFGIVVLKSGGVRNRFF
jgi:hypothetical protein